MPGPDFQFQAQQNLLAKHQADIRDLKQANAPARSWVPRLVGNISDPTNTGQRIGTYTRTGDWVTARFQFRLNGWSLAVGSTLALDSPWVPDTPIGNQMAGQWWAQDSSTGAFAAGTLLSVGNGTVVSTRWWFMDSNGNYAMDVDTPWTWASSDYISGFLTFQAAAGY